MGAHQTGAGELFHLQPAVGVARCHPVADDPGGGAVGDAHAVAEQDDDVLRQTALTLPALEGIDHLDPRGDGGSTSGVGEFGRQRVPALVREGGSAEVEAAPASGRNTVGGRSALGPGSESRGVAIDP